MRVGSTGGEVEELCLWVMITLGKGKVLVLLAGLIWYGILGHWTWTLGTGHSGILGSWGLGVYFLSLYFSRAHDKIIIDTPLGVGGVAFCIIVVMICFLLLGLLLGLGLGFADF